MSLTAKQLSQQRVGARVTLDGGQGAHTFSLEFMKMSNLQWSPVRNALPDLWSDALAAQAERIGATINRV